MPTKSKTYTCLECDDFEMEVTYTGEPGTQSDEDYQKLSFDSCPACGGEVDVDETVEDGEETVDTDLERLVEDDPTEDVLVYRAGIEVAEQVQQTPTLSAEHVFETVIDELSVPSHRENDVREVAKGHHYGVFQ